MKYCLLLITGFLFLIKTGNGQQQSLPENEVLLIQHKPIFFTFETPEDLLAPQIVPGAFELKVTSGQRNLKAFVQLRSGGNLQSSPLSKLLVLKLAQKGSLPSSTTNSDILLSEFATPLFTIPGRALLSQQHFFLYDMKLLPSKTFIKPGSYNFSLIFTITPE